MRTTARVLLTLGLAAAACAGGYELWDYYLFSPWARDARVQADVVSIAPDVAGYVNELRVKDNQFVHKGDTLMVIDQARYTRALAQADATVAARKADMENAAQRAARRAKLTEIAISSDGARDCDICCGLSCGHLPAGGRGPLDRPAQPRPHRGAGTSQWVCYQPDPRYWPIRLGRHQGHGIDRQQLLPSYGLFEETKIPVIKRGEDADIYLLGGAPRLRGHVQSIARGITDRDNPTGPELLVNANPTFEWVRLAQRIPVRVRIDHVPKGVLVSSGMTCTVVVGAPPRQWAILAVLRGWQAAAR